MGKHDYISKEILDHVLGGPDYVRVANIDFALYTTAPTHTTAGTEVSTSGTAYGRITVPNDGTFWAAAITATPSSKTSIDDVTWLTATANWGTVVAAAIFEAGTSNMMYFGNLTVSRVVNLGDSVRFAAGGVVATET